MSGITPDQQQLKDACVTARQDAHQAWNRGASREDMAIVVRDFFRACRAYTLAGGNVGYAMWDVPTGGETQGRLNSEVTAWQSGYVAYLRDEVTLTAPVWAVLLQKFSGPPHLAQFNVSPDGQIAVTGMDPTPETRFLMMRILNPGPMTEEEIQAATVGAHDDWLPLGWLGLRVMGEGEGGNIRATG